MTRCPYKGTTTGYWSVVVDGVVHEDLAWCYDFPTRQLSPIAGLVAFYNEQVDVFVDGELLERPAHPFLRLSRPRRRRAAGVRSGRAVCHAVTP